jgi:hypothetical protein
MMGFYNRTKRQPLLVIKVNHKKGLFMINKPLAKAGWLCGKGLDNQRCGALFSSISCADEQ